MPMEIPKKDEINASIRVPGSKSITHRALILSFLSGSGCLIKNPSVCEDTLRTVKGLRALGCQIEIRKDSIDVKEREQTSLNQDLSVDMGESGTTLRLLLGLFAVLPCRVHVTGKGRLNERPIGPLVGALVAMGARIIWHRKEGFLPLSIEGGSITGGDISIWGGESSQYISSLMLIGPLLKEGLSITVRPPLLSWPYVKMTAGVMKEFGAKVEVVGNHIWVPPCGYFSPSEYQVEPDCSNASYFMGLPLLAGGRIFMEGISYKSLQGDIGVLDLIEEMGGKLVVLKDGIEIRGCSLKAVDADMKDMPDLVPTIAALAAHASGVSQIRNVPHLRLKESDRLRSISTEWQKLGVEVEELEDGIRIKGKGVKRGVTVFSHGDHRIAMAIALLGSKKGGIRLWGHEAVKKSFPKFWEEWKRV